MREQRELALLRQPMDDVERAVIILMRDGRVRLMTSRADQWLEEYFGNPSWVAKHLPKALQFWVRQQEAVLTGTDGVPRPREPLVLERNGKRLVVRLLSDPNQSLLLLEEQHTALKPASLESLDLTRRETEVLRWIALGKTNIEVGRVLGLSARTIQKHLEHIYQKLGVETRTAATARALEAVGRMRA